MQFNVCHLLSSHPASTPEIVQIRAKHLLVRVASGIEKQCIFPNAYHLEIYTISLSIEAICGEEVNNRLVLLCRLCKFLETLLPGIRFEAFTKLAFDVEKFYNISC